MNILVCQHCGNRNKDISIALYCSNNCKQDHEAAQIERRQKEMETHHPWNRWTDEEKEIATRIHKMRGVFQWLPQHFIGQPTESVSLSISSPHPQVRTSEGKYKCKICGIAGHNSRSCSQNPENIKKNKKF